MRYEVTVKNIYVQRSAVVEADDEIEAAFRAGAVIGSKGFKIVSIRPEEEAS